MGDYSITLKNDSFVDPFGQTHYLGDIAPGESRSITQPHTVTADDMDNNTLSNAVTVNGDAPSGTVSGSASDEVQAGDTAPEVTLNKTTHTVTIRYLTDGGAPIRTIPAGTFYEGETYNVQGQIDGAVEYGGSRYVRDSQTAASGTMGTGNVTVTARYAIDTNRDGTADKNQDVVVYVTGHSDSVTYNGRRHSVSGYDVTAITVGGRTVSALPAGVTLSGSATAAGTNAGTYAVRPALTVTRGTFRSVTVSAENGQLTIARKAVTVRANNRSKTAGSPDPRLTATVTGLVGGGTVRYTLSRRAGNTAGSYAIYARGEQVQGNYTVTFINGAMTIRAAGTAPDDDDTTRIDEDDTPLGARPASADEDDAETVSIDEDDTPLGALPATKTKDGAKAKSDEKAEAGTVNIDEDDTPLGGLPEGDGDKYTLDEEVTIDEGETPLAGSPESVEHHSPWHFFLMLAALGVAIYYTSERKRAQRREFELRSSLK